MSDLSSILSRVLAADGPDRELDAAICVAFYDIPDPPRAWRVDCVSDSGVVRSYTPARYTASLDAALALVERVRPGAGYRIEYIPNNHPNNRGWASCGLPGEQEATYAKTPALALLAALIKSKMEMENETV